MTKMTKWQEMTKNDKTWLRTKKFITKMKKKWQNDKNDKKKIFK